jgi:iron complex outermembrane recepter protein
VSTFRVNDPVLCPGGVVNTAAGGIASRDCNKQYETQTGGNVDLEPEQSDIYALGFTVRPVDRLQIGADYWNYTIEQTIGVINVPTVAGNPAQFGSQIVRCASAPAAIINLLSTCLQPTGNPIGYFDIRLQNLGETRTSGIDFTVNYSTDELSWGQFVVDYRSSWTLEYEFQRQTNGEFFDRLGQYAGVDPAVFEYQHVLSFGWVRDKLSGQLTNRYRSGYTDCNAGCLIPTAFHQDADAYSTWDLAVSYRPVEALSLMLRVENMLDEDPPFTNKTSGLATGWDERFADPLGRAYGLGVTYRF